MSGPAVLSYVTAERSPGRWGVMGSSQFSHIIQKYLGYIHGGVCAVDVLLKFPLLNILSKVNWFLWYSNGPYHHFKMASRMHRDICSHTPSPWLQGWMGDCLGVLMMTLPRLINSTWLLEHQVKDNQVLVLQPGLTVLTLPQLQLRTSRAHSWVP